MFTQSPANATYFSTCPGNSVQVLETQELLPAASTPFSSDGNVSFSSNTTTLTIGFGASASAPQYIRFGYRSRALTATNTLTLTSGSGTGSVSVYAFLTPGNTLSFFALDTSGCVFTIGTGSVVTAPGATIPFGAILIYVIPVNAGVFGAGSGQLNPTDCWVDSIEVANITGTAATILAADGQGTPIQLFPTQSVAANSTLLYTHPGGRFFDGGLFLTAGTASALHVSVRLCRLHKTLGSAGLNN